MRRSIFRRYRRRSFWYGYWEVAGKYFKLKSSLDPRVLFECSEFISEKKEYAIRGYFKQIQGSETQRIEYENRRAQYCIKNNDGKKG